MRLTKENYPELIAEDFIPCECCGNKFRNEINLMTGRGCSEGMDWCDGCLSLAATTMGPCDACRKCPEHCGCEGG